MSMNERVLLLGGTGRTGRRVLAQLLGRGVAVRAIVRSRGGLPADVAGPACLEVVECSLLSLADEELREHLRGCTAVVSCLGHTLTIRGVLGPPRDLVTRATRRVCVSIEALRPARPVKLVLMSSVSVEQPGRVDARRGAPERAFTWLLRALLPPARDNQHAADFLREAVRSAHHGERRAPHVRARHRSRDLGGVEGAPARPRRRFGRGGNGARSRGRDGPCGPGGYLHGAFSTLPRWGSDGQVLDRLALAS